MAIRNTQRLMNNASGTFDQVTANGNVTSIQQWAKLAFEGDEEDDVIDLDQKRAFEIICAHFVLTYYREAERNERGFSQLKIDLPHRHSHISQWKELHKLGGIGKKNQLLMFLCGVGGSGKSKVMNAVQQYAKAFCDQLGVKYDKRTIVVTALTGIAATAINGETLHSAAKMGPNQKVNKDDVKEWKDARLLIIDKISFANRMSLTKIDKNLRELTEEEMLPYGGMNIIFARDFRQLEPI